MVGTIHLSNTGCEIKPCQCWCFSMSSTPSCKGHLACDRLGWTNPLKVGTGTWPIEDKATCDRLGWTNPLIVHPAGNWELGTWLI